MKTFGDIVSEVAQMVGNLATDSYTKNVIPRFVNSAYREIWDAEIWPDTLSDPIIVTIPGGTDLFTLDKRYSAIVRAYIDSSGQQLKVRDMATFSQEYYEQTRSYNIIASFNSIAPLAAIGVKAQLTVAQTVNVYSSAADTIMVFIKGTDANGETISELVTLNGTTPVQSALSYTNITGFSKLAIPTTGIISLADGANTTLATIGMWERTARYRRYMINGVQGQSVDLRLICKKSFQPFLNYYDYPFMDLDNTLPHKSTAFAWRENRNVDLAAQEEQLYANELGKLRQREISEEGTQLFVPMRRG